MTKYHTDNITKSGNKVKKGLDLYGLNALSYGR